VRIIAGSRKGARIFAPRGSHTRPTADRVREAAFNLVGPGFAEDAAVLDLFAGSGAMGLEALSRGAASATFVENDRDACRAINRNLDKLGLDATVLCQDALTALRADARAGTRYDLVLVDPPYRRFSSLQKPLIRHLPEVLAPEGVLLVETAAAEEPDLPALAVRTSRRYGSARLTLFEHEPQ